MTVIDAPRTNLDFLRAASRGEAPLPLAADLPDSRPLEIERGELTASATATANIGRIGSEAAGG